MKNKSPRVLLLDIETAPMILLGWSIQGPQFFGLENIIEDWSMLSFSAKFLGENKMHYADNRNKKNPRDDKEIVKKLHKLMSQADILVYQYGDRFDLPAIKARIEFHGLKRLPQFRSFDTQKIAKKNFKLTSYKLEYMCQYFGLKHKKLKDRKYNGLSLWKACLNNNKSAWEEMELYNKRDVQALEDLYNVLAPYGTLNFDVYNDNTIPTCNCGSVKLQKRGFNYTSKGKYQRYQCTNCGAWHSKTDKKDNLLKKDKKLLKRL